MKHVIMLPAALDAVEMEATPTMSDEEWASLTAGLAGVVPSGKPPGGVRERQRMRILILENFFEEDSDG